MSKQAERAELIQSLKAFLIPSSLFLATVIMSGGTFLIYYGYALGWAFIAVSATIMICAFVAFIKFQNKLRVKGQIAGEDEAATAVCVEQSESAPTLCQSKELDKVGTTLVALLVTLACSSAGLAETQQAPAFDRLKALTGDWVGKDEDKVPCHTHFEIASGGTAVLERLKVGSHPEMLDVYHMDIDKVMCTHYCNANNQPRMRQKEFDPASGTLNFGFVDVSNLKDPAAGCMKELKLKMPDANHLVEEWTWSQGGKESTSVFNLERATSIAGKKSS